jgi:hypothetical protein
LFDLFNDTSWELQGQRWIEEPPLPLVADGSTPEVSYNPADGSVAILAALEGVGSVLMIRERTSSTPLESCAPGDDLDGDGLSGCDDPDCFWACP